MKDLYAKIQFENYTIYISNQANEALVKVLMKALEKKA